MSGATFGCPQCGGTEGVYEGHKVVVDYQVLSWDEDGHPQEYGHSDMVDGSAEPVDPERRYCCAECGHEFGEPKRLDTGGDG